jgi:glycosyltransferase involved in cell wall biosynthesis
MTRKLKILHTMTWLAPGGGVDNNVFLTIDGLKDKFDFHLAVGCEIHHNDFAKIEGLKIIICKDLVRPVSPVKDIKALYYFWKLIRKEKYDIVHTHEAKAGLITRVAAFFAGCKFIVFGLHGVTFNDPYSKSKRYFYILAEKLTTRMADFIVSVSQDAITEYHKVNIGRKVPSKVVYSGIDINKFINPAFTKTDSDNLRHQLGINNKDIVLLNVGRFSYAKAQCYTIESFARLKNQFSNVKLLLVGEGELKEACIQQAEVLGVRTDTIFYGFSDNIPLISSLADIFVITSLREGLPRVVVEASLCRLPTVGFEVEGIGEIIENNESGYIVPKYDTKMLCNRIKTLIEKKGLRKTFANKAFEKARNNWDHRKMLEQLSNIYLKGAMEKYQ